MSGDATLIEARDIMHSFRGRGDSLFRRAPRVRALDGVSLAIAAGEMLALVGESGSGKSTLGRMLLGLATPASGVVFYRGQPLSGLQGAAWKAFRREVQVVFQDTGGALNPRRSVAASVAVPLRYNLGLSAAAASAEADRLLDRVELSPAQFRHRLPHELSGGQRQRVGIARAIASRPRLIVADEPVSALDVSVRAQVLRLLRDIQRQDGTAFLFITHDLGVVRALADRIAVMRRGVVVEQGPAHAVLDSPADDYTRALLAAVPRAIPPAHSV